jgi:hypothetical protein
MTGFLLIKLPMMIYSITYFRISELYFPTNDMLSLILDSWVGLKMGQLMLNCIYETDKVERKR